MEFDGGMIWTRQASAAQAAGWHPETSTILLHQDIGREFGRPENRVRGLIDGKILRIPGNRVKANQRSATPLTDCSDDPIDFVGERKTNGASGENHSGSLGMLIGHRH
jgi:hypothetical protein